MRLDGRDLLRRPDMGGFEPSIASREPWDREELVAAGLEQEGNEGKPDDIGREIDEDAREPLMLVEEPDGADLHQFVHHGRDQEDDQRRIGREPCHEAADRLLQPLERNEADDVGDDRMQMIPEPGKAEEDQRDDRPDYAAEMVHRR